MKKIVTMVMFFVMLVCLNVQAEDTAGDKVLMGYFVGNSLTGSITLDRVHEILADEGVDFQFGTQIVGGSDLQMHLKRLDEGGRMHTFETNKPVDGKYKPGARWGNDPFPKRYGKYFEAIENHQWDVIVYTPGVTPNPEAEIKAFSKFLDHAIEHQKDVQIYMYTLWLQRPVVRDAEGNITKEIGLIDFSAIWEGKAPLPPGGMPKARSIGKDYYEFLDMMNKKYEGKLDRPILLIPLGDVFCELDKRLKAGQVTGIEALYKRDPNRVPSWDDELKESAGVNIFYADRIHPVKLPHTDATIGNYVYGMMFYAVLTGKSPVGLSGAEYELDDVKDAELIKALQECVWDVVKGHRYTGVK